MTGSVCFCEDLGSNVEIDLCVLTFYHVEFQQNGFDIRIHSNHNRWLEHAVCFNSQSVGVVMSVPGV